MKCESEMTVSSRAVSAFWKVCMGILFLSALFMGLFLGYYSTRFSFYSPNANEFTLQMINDLWWANLLCFAAASLICVILERCFCMLGNRQRLAGYLFLGLNCVIFAVVCTCWTIANPYYPSGDQLGVAAAAVYNLQGKFDMFSNTGYIGIYSQQKGIVFLYEILFSVFGNYCFNVVEKLHVAMGVATMVFGYLFVEENAPWSICKIIYCPLVLFCVPYLVLTPYIYGDLPSICFCTVLFWSLQRYGRTLRAGYAVLSCIVGILSLMCRTNTWVVFIAVGISMLLLAVQRRKLRPIWREPVLYCRPF